MFLKKFLGVALLSVLSLGVLHADQVAVVSFKGLNNNANATLLEPTQAQDLLNVDVSYGGKSVLKRSGYGLYKALGTGKAVHGGIHFFDSTGNDVQVWGSSTSLYGIVADGTVTQLISSATLNSTWDCVDIQGFAYCADSNRDALIKTNGATQTWYSSALGTMVEATPDRLVVAGVSATPNTLYVSQSNTYTNFTIGVNNTDAFTEVIASPGSKLTHIRWGCGKLLWWKDASFGYLDFDNQYVAQVKTVSDTIGTFDNTSAIDPGGQVWFRGQDGHIWKYDCTSLSRESLDISSNTQASQKRVANLWTQSTQAEFQAGTSIPTNNTSTTISPGDVIVSSFQAVENSSAQWNSGSANSLTVNPSSITLTLDAVALPNYSFESGQTTNWTVGGSGWSNGVSDAQCAGLNAVDGALFETLTSNGYASLLTCDGSVIISSNTSLASGTDCKVWAVQTLPYPSSYIGKCVKLQFCSVSGCASSLTSDNFILNGNPIQYDVTAGKGVPPRSYLDLVSNIITGKIRSDIATGSFTSQAYNTGFTSSTFQISEFNWVANTTTPTFSLQTATSTLGTWRTVLTSSATNAVGDQFVRWVSTITIGSSDNALTAISSITFISRSTGTYYSSVRSAPNFTSWGTLGVNSANNAGTQTFYVRGSSQSITVLSSTPAWTAITAGSLITATTGIFLQFRDDYALTAATQTPTLNDFTLNWFEGSATDQAYMIYFKDAIWASVADGAGQSTNNYIFRNDLVNDLWTVYSFGAGGMVIQGQNLYFGDTSTSGGNIFQYGTSTSDNGAAINSYWKSKEFTGSDPFLQSQLTQLDTFSKKNQGSTVTATYTVDTSSATSFSVGLSTPNAIVQSRKLLPSGKLGYTFNIQYGDNSASSAWEIFGFRIGYIPQPYRPTP